MTSVTSRVAEVRMLIAKPRELSGIDSHWWWLLLLISNLKVGIYGLDLLHT
jgi:hypothetical protein